MASSSVSSDVSDSSGAVRPGAESCADAAAASNKKHPANQGVLAILLIRTDPPALIDSLRLDGAQSINSHHL